MVDFNADLGESFGVWERGADAQMLNCITSANVACGFHAGDPVTMATTIARAADHGVALGAHPGYPDLLGFGRRRLAATPSEVEAYLTYQLGALLGFIVGKGLSLHHVKPHGALYAAALDDPDVARAIALAVARQAPGVAVYTLAGSSMWAAADKQGLRPVAEFFADRPIRGDGSYEFFNWRDLFELDPVHVTTRTVRAVIEGKVRTLDGTDVMVKPETICLHSDTPGAGTLGPALRSALESAGVELEAP